MRALAACQAATICARVGLRSSTSATTASSVSSPALGAPASCSSAGSETVRIDGDSRARDGSLDEESAPMLVVGAATRLLDDGSAHPDEQTAPKRRPKQNELNRGRIM